jgi:hypothetical protein
MKKTSQIVPAMLLTGRCMCCGESLIYRLYAYRSNSHNIQLNKIIFIDLNQNLNFLGG